MFGSTNPFGQSSNSPFGSPSVFGQPSGGAPADNPFAPKPFGSPNSFGAQTGSSLFGGTSTGVFGQASSAPAFGATQPFGGSTSVFGAPSAAAPAFGASSSAFGGSSMFGQKPAAFGGFGSSPSQSSPFGSTLQQTQSAFGSNLFGSTTPFSGSSQPAFGAASAPAFGAATTPTFGSTTFGSTTAPAFGSTTTPFGSTGTGFGGSSAPAFGSSVTPAFGAQNSSLFGSSTPSAFGASSNPAFGSAPAFGSSSTPSLGFGSTAFGQSNSTFGSTTFGTTPSPFASQGSPFGAQTTTPTSATTGFGQSVFGGQSGGSRVASFVPTPEVDGTSNTQTAAKLESISAMPVYKDKSHEELRWEDYQRGDKGGPNPSGQPAGLNTFSAPAPANPFGSTSTFAQTPTNPFSTTNSNPFAPKTSTPSSSTFGSPSTSLFNTAFNSSSPFASSTGTQTFGATNTGFGSNTTSSLFGGATSTTSSAPLGSSLTFGNTQSSGLFQSTTPSIGQQPSPFGQPSAGFPQATSGFGSSFLNPSTTGFGGSSLFTSSPASFGQTNPSFSNAFQTAGTPQTSGAFPVNNFSQTQPATSGGFGNMFNQGMFGQSAAPQSNMVVQPAVITNPFGTLPAMPQMSIGRVGSAPSVQYGISSMPIAERPTPVRISSLLTPRHLSQRRIRLPARKYHPKNDGQRVPFFADDEAAPTAPKADAYFIPRENPRALIIRPIEPWPSRTTGENQSTLKYTHPANGNGKVTGEPSAPAFDESFGGDYDENPTENGHNREYNNAPLPQSESSQKANGSHTDHAQKGMDSSYITISGHRAGEAAIVYEHGADIEALMPKLRHTDYYTEPRIQELAAKERAEPGFCRHVQDFVVGRQGYGSIKFLGETDVRRLDLESIVQFNNREVIVYKDENNKPPVGQGLNKPAEVTLLNIKCVNKKTGQQYTEGPKVDKYKEMLMKKAEEQGAKFVSYDPAKGEWIFKVKHFSRYEFGDGCPDVSEADEFGEGGIKQL